MKVLYVTYDGLLDPLGQSQILPYLRSIRHNVESLHIISFEKSEHQMDKISTLQHDLNSSDISWSYLGFTQSKNLLFKLQDVFKLLCLFGKICLWDRPNLVHARGHPMAMLSLPYKFFFRFRLLFDYRGVWADERVVKGGWDLAKTFDRWSYNFFSWVERFIVEYSDHIVVLTNTVKVKLLHNTNQIDVNITVIPCACAFSLFNILRSSKSTKKIPEESCPKVLGYLGSIGPLYNFNFYLEVLQACIEHGITCKGLVVTNNINEANNAISLLNHPQLRSYIEITQASRSEVPMLINQMHFLLSFITTFKSTIGACPTKIGEALACGVPIISNSGIGDIDTILHEADAGIILPSYSKVGVGEAIKFIASEAHLDRQSIRENSRKYFDLDIANESYRRVYEMLQDLA